MIAEVNGYAYSFSDDALWVHLYGSNVLELTAADGAAVRVVQEANYPWDGKIVLTVECPAAAMRALMLRIPGWANGTIVTINGMVADAEATPG